MPSLPAARNPYLSSYISLNQVEKAERTPLREAFAYFFIAVGTASAALGGLVSNVVERDCHCRSFCRPPLPTMHPLLVHSWPWPRVAFRCVLV